MLSYKYRKSLSEAVCYVKILSLTFTNGASDVRVVYGQWRIGWMRTSLQGFSSRGYVLRILQGHFRAQKRI
jgi:hypothetical protein